MSHDYSLMTGIPRGVAVRDGRAQTLEEQRMPDAAFMDPGAIAASRALAHDGGKVFLGVIGGDLTNQTSGARLERHVTGGKPIGIGDDRHIVTVAGSRSGKGRSVIVPTLLRYEGAALMIDPKGELATITARARHERLGQRVLVIDPFGVARGTAARLRRKRDVNRRSSAA